MEPLVLPGTMDSLEILGKYVRDAAVTAGLSKEAAYKLRLAVDEIATNVVMHGYDEHGIKGDIGVSAEITDSEIVITLEDSGPAYDPRSARMPGEEDLARDLKTRAVGGLGVFLTLKSVDEFDHRRENDRNLNIFRVRREKPGKGSAP